MDTLLPRNFTWPPIEDGSQDLFSSSREIAVNRFYTIHERHSYDSPDHGGFTDSFP